MAPLQVHRICTRDSDLADYGATKTRLTCPLVILSSRSMLLSDVGFSWIRTSPLESWGFHHHHTSCVVLWSFRPMYTCLKRNEHETAELKVRCGRWPGVPRPPCSRSWFSGTTALEKRRSPEHSAGRGSFRSTPRGRPCLSPRGVSAARVIPQQSLRRVSSVVPEKRLLKIGVWNLEPFSERRGWSECSNGGKSL